MQAICGGPRDRGDRHETLRAATTVRTPDYCVILQTSIMIYVAASCAVSYEIHQSKVLLNHDDYHFSHSGQVYSRYSKVCDPVEIVIII